MPIVKTHYCDDCNKEMDSKECYLFYRVDYWSKNKHHAITSDYLNRNDCALMFCSPECIGIYLSKLLDGDIVEDD